MTNPWSAHLQLVNTLLTKRDRLIREKDDLVVSKDKLWQLANTLLSEKDQLIREKDELVASKDKLWRELYEITRDRDSEIQRLRTKAELLAVENSELRVRPVVTHLDETEASGDETSEAGSELDSVRPRSDSKRPHSPSRLEGRISKSTKTESSEDSFYTAPNSSNPDAELCGADDASEENSTDEPTNNVSMFLQHHKFTVIPLIGINDKENYEIGTIQHVSSVVVDSVCQTFDEIKSRQRQGKRPICPKVPNSLPYCAWLWALECSSNHRWTMQSPRNYACASCFNARRACLLWLGDMRWLILPLPPQVQKEAATWEDSDYYIYSGSEVAASFTGVWRGGRKAGGKSLAKDST